MVKRSNSAVKTAKSKQTNVAGVTKSSGVRKRGRPPNKNKKRRKSESDDDDWDLDESEPDEPTNADLRRWAFASVGLKVDEADLHSDDDQLPQSSLPSLKGLQSRVGTVRRHALLSSQRPSVVDKDLLLNPHSEFIYPNNDVGMELNEEVDMKWKLGWKCKRRKERSDWTEPPMKRLCLRRSSIVLFEDVVLQLTSCEELSCLGVPQCLACAVKTSVSICRFTDFRLLRRSGRRKMEVAGFLTVSGRAESRIVHTNLGAEIRLDRWLPPSTSNWTGETGAYVLRHIAPTFDRVLEDERQCLRMMRSQLKTGVGDCEETLWRPSDKTRELCDVCLSTLFNLHLLCPDCGFMVCNSCVRLRNSGQFRKDEPSFEHDRFSWPFCVVNAEKRVEDDDVTRMKRLHHPSSLRLVQLIPDSIDNVLATMENVKERMDKAMKERNIGLRCVCGDSEALERCLCAQPTESVQPQHLCKGGLLVLSDAKWVDNAAHFQSHWRESKPVVIANVHKQLDADMWSPERFRQMRKSGKVVDCRAGLVTNVTLDDFWDGFVDDRKRPENKAGRKMALKLKDFPTTATFKRVFPEHYRSLCGALPLPTYTLPEANADGGGRLNLVTKLSKSYVKPDLGPKMYNAYGMMGDEDCERATTNLHLDISDACNLLAHVTVAAGPTDDQQYKALVWRLKEEGIEEGSLDFERVRVRWREAGAVWSIFQPQDNERIRCFINRMMSLSDEKLSSYVAYDAITRLRGLRTDDAIHDQSFFLTAKLRRLLEREWGVKGCTFVQMLGDAVFIPAGAPHQVQNLFSCVKVAEDFVTPEGTALSLVITDELRALTRRHQNQEDKLQLKNIVYFAVCDAVTALERSDWSIEQERQRNGGI